MRLARKVSLICIYHFYRADRPMRSVSSGANLKGGSGFND